MRRWRAVMLGLVGLAVASVAVLALALRYESACPPAGGADPGTEAMRALQRRCYGGTDRLAIERVSRPALAADTVLVKVQAASVNPLDWHYMRGKPYIMRLDSGLGAPKSPKMGVDFAGTVEAIGTGVTRFKVGDRVFGARDGALADYVAAREGGALVTMPEGIAFADAAAVPVAAMTALQAVRDKGRVAAGQKVLVNGASGGVGTYAVQIARALGAEVTGVCSTRNVELVRSLGAQHVVDYTRDDFTQGTERYDVIIDNVGTHALSEYRRVMTPTGALVVVGSVDDGDYLGPLTTLIRAKAAGTFGSQRVEAFISSSNAADLATLRDLMQRGALRSAIDRTYPFAQAAEAIAYLETGRARGKVIVDLTK
jgi:NADPH:quinone reductase-like Zn-dependent oxidoreductase